MRKGAEDGKAPASEEGGVRLQQIRELARIVSPPGSLGDSSGDDAVYKLGCSPEPKRDNYAQSESGPRLL